MDSQTRLLTAWSHREPDRVPIELRITPEAAAFPEAERIVDFIAHEADNFGGAPGADWGFLGLDAEYAEETIEDVPGDYYRLRRTYATPVGEFHAITKHQHETLIPSDFLWERYYVDNLEELQRLAEAPRATRPLHKERFDEAVTALGKRGVALVGLLHPLGWLVRNANLRRMYIWFLEEKEVIHTFLANANRQVSRTVEAMGQAGIGPYFTVTAHEMLIPPWMGQAMFDEFVAPYDRAVFGAVRRIGGKLRIHCHGNCMAFLGQFADMGVDAIEPLEHPPFGDVDLAQAKQLVGDRMMLSGNIPSQLFTTMTPAEVRGSVKAAIQAAAPGGGFSLRPSGAGAGTMSAQDPEQMRHCLRSIEAYIDAALELGAYPIRV